MSLDPKQAESMRDALLGKLENEHAATLSVLEHVPEDRIDYRLHEKVRSFGELSFHIYTTGPWFAGIIESGNANAGGGGEKPKAPGTRKELIAACDALHKSFVKSAAGYSGAILARDIEFFTFGSFPAVSFIDWHISHLIHHRGQLTMFLRVMGAKVPAIYGDSIDYPMK